MSDSKATKAQNLARIRDNQRRSRARRKEYLHELEAKLRCCEQVGIEASAEIQSAARKVLEENRKLRALLHERGVPESEIVAVMGGPTDRTYDHVSTAPILNTMLERKITCNGLSGSGSPASTHSTSVPMPSQTPAVPSISIPVQRTAALSSNDSPSPHSLVSSMGTPPGYSSNPFYTAPMTPTPEVKTENMPYNYQYEPSINNSWAFSNNAQYVADPIAYYNTSSCVDAANIIRTMRSDVGPELEADLGCRAPGQDCYVNNSVVFTVMDKYSNQQHGV